MSRGSSWRRNGTAVWAHSSAVGKPLAELPKQLCNMSVLMMPAFNAIAAIPGHEAETFRALAGFVRAGKDRDAAIRALRRLPKKTWPEKEL